MISDNELNQILAGNIHCDFDVIKEVVSNLIELRCLINATPDLLEACKAALEHFPVDVPEEHVGEMAAVFAKLCAAIEKAEPES